MPRGLAGIAAITLAIGCTAADPEGPCGTWYPDLDRDGYGDESAPVEVCAPAIPPGGLLTRGGDCNDANPAVNAGAAEVCDGTGVDEDCDGRLDDDDDNIANGRTVWADDDGDGFGDPDSTPLLVCVGLEGYIANDEDCDDDNAATYPGAADQEDPSACMTDADEDGFGARTPDTGVTPGTDCDDDDPARSPGAVERLDDGVDQTCNGHDVWFVSEGFDDGVADSPVVDTLTLGTVTTTVGHSGTHSIRLPSEGALTTRPLGTRSVDDGGSCANLRWSFWTYRRDKAPQIGDSMTLMYWNGVDYEDLYTIGATGVGDDAWSFHTGLVTSPDAYRDDFRLRWQVSFMKRAAAFHIDDVQIACTGIDGDGDEYGVNLDCIDDDDRHWQDCGVCVDEDDDGFGVGCDLGPDCGEGDATIHPDAADSSPDGTDQNCDGIDGAGFVDRFETSKGEGWDMFPAEVAYGRVYVANGFGSLHLSGSTVLTRSETIDTSACTELGWALLAKRGPTAPLPADSFTLEWSDGSGWTPVLELAGGTLDPLFLPYRGVISDPDALAPALSFRVTTSADPASDHFVDDLAVGCDPVDDDGDGFWSGIEDCDDGDAAIGPRAPDTFGDDIDQDCDGIDG